MKFQCLNPNCKKVFLYTAKQTKESELAVDEGEVIETHVCPYCHGLDFEELVETVQAEKVCSVKSVELDKVDDWITQGYEVKELYAKTATMIKKEAKI
jgi:hypothetical protein